MAPHRSMREKRRKSGKKGSKAPLPSMSKRERGATSHISLSKKKIYRGKGRERKGRALIFLPSLTKEKEGVLIDRKRLIPEDKGKEGGRKGGGGKKKTKKTISPLSLRAEREKGF